MKSMSLKRGHARGLSGCGSSSEYTNGRVGWLEQSGVQILLPPLKVNLGSMNFNKTEHAVFTETFLSKADQRFQNRKVALSVLKIPLVLTLSLSFNQSLDFFLG